MADRHQAPWRPPLPPHWPGGCVNSVTHGSQAKLTQAEVAEALSDDEPAAISSLSAWENTSTPTLPTQRRLAAYARFFATARSLEGRPHLFPSPS